MANKKVAARIVLNGYFEVDVPSPSELANQSERGIAESKAAAISEMLHRVFPKIKNIDIEVMD